MRQRVSLMGEHITAGQRAEDELRSRDFQFEQFVGERTRHLEEQLVFSRAITTGLAEGITAMYREGHLACMNPAAERGARGRKDDQRLSNQATR